MNARQLVEQKRVGVHPVNKAEYIALLKELVANATPGECRVRRVDAEDGCIDYEVVDDEEMHIVSFDQNLHDDMKMKANAELYAASRTAIPELIAALEEERAENARLKAMMPQTPTTCAYFKPVGVCMCPHTTRDVWNCRTYEGGTCARDAWQLQEGSDG